MGYATTVKEANDFKPFPRGLKDGPNRRRVLPGIHSCSETGEWAKKYSTHTYAIPREDDPEKKDYVTFKCLEVVDWVNREKVVLEKCDECVLIEDREAEYKRLHVKLGEELKNGLRTKDEVRKLLRPHVEWKKRHSRSFWWAINVVDSDGKYFTEKWPNDVKKQFDALKKKLKDQDNIGAILPIDQGVWVDIVKTPGNETGTGFPAYKVEVVMERMPDGSKKEKLAPIPPESSIDAEKSCWDLNDPGVVTLTREQVHALVSSGDSPEVVRGIFKQSARPTASTPNRGLGGDSNTLTPGHDVPSMDRRPVNGGKPEAPADPIAELAKEAAKPESDDDRMLREAEEAVAAAQAFRAKAQAARLAKTPVDGPGAKPEVKPTPTPTPKPEPKTANVDEDLDKFMSEFDLKGE